MYLLLIKAQARAEHTILPSSKKLLYSVIDIFALSSFSPCVLSGNISQRICPDTASLHQSEPSRPGSPRCPPEHGPDRSLTFSQLSWDCSLRFLSSSCLDEKGNPNIYKFQDNGEKRNVLVNIDAKHQRTHFHALRPTAQILQLIAQPLSLLTLKLAII